MADNLPTIWKADPHTFAKHEILKVYLQKWSTILSNYIKDRKQFLLFVDGFAGPGIYKGGEDGSPILAIKTVLNHSQRFPTPISFLFIEEDKERHDVLIGLLKRMKQQTDESEKISTIDIELGDCEDILNGKITDLDNKGHRFGPALVFLDQFGYSDVSLKLIALIMKHKMCEVFSFLHWDSMNRFYEDESKWDAITKSYGSEAWKKVFSLPHTERATFMLNLYMNSLKKSGEAKFVWHFKMKNKNGKLIYWLFFCTNNLKGLKEMKAAMWKVDTTGGFCFSDKDNQDQLHFLREYNEQMLADDILKKFRGKIVQVSDVKHFVLTETPAYKYKPSLRKLESDNKLSVINPLPKRRRGTFACENQLIEFR